VANNAVGGQFLSPRRGNNPPARGFLLVPGQAFESTILPARNSMHTGAVQGGQFPIISKFA
jgi:hypothetical protein